MRRLIVCFCLLALSTTLVTAQQYDLVLEGGRVVDPETGLDGVRNVGIRDGKIVRVSAEVLSGRRVVHAGGLVVAPGFIDLHQHGQDMASQRVKALDGVKTHLHRELVPILENSQEYRGLSMELMEALRRFQGAHGVLLRRHGLYTWGKSLADARRHLEALEFLFEVEGRRLMGAFK